MKVRVKLFASLVDVAGARQLDLEMADAPSVAQVWDRLVSEHPRLSAHSNSLLRAVNEEFCKPDAIVREGDEVAFFPPVSGG